MGVAGGDDLGLEGRRFVDVERFAERTRRRQARGEAIGIARTEVDHIDRPIDVAEKIAAARVVGRQQSGDVERHLEIIIDGLGQGVVRYEFDGKAELAAVLDGAGLDQDVEALAGDRGLGQRKFAMIGVAAM